VEGIRGALPLGASICHPFIKEKIIIFIIAAKILIYGFAPYPATFPDVSDRATLTPDYE
jgi:hypothetical protein